MNEERAYAEGQRQAYRALLGLALRNLEPEDRGAAALAAERADAVAMLRRACADHGDNDWPDSLHLADVIEKHLLPYLDADDEPAPAGPRAGA